MNWLKKWKRLLMTGHRGHRDDTLCIILRPKKICLFLGFVCLTVLVFQAIKVVLSKEYKLSQITSKEWRHSNIFQLLIKKILVSCAKFVPFMIIHLEKCPLKSQFLFMPFLRKQKIIYPIFIIRTHFSNYKKNFRILITS